MKQAYIILGLSVGAMVFFTIAFIFNVKTLKQGQAFYENLYIEIIHSDSGINESLPQPAKPIESTNNRDFHDAETGLEIEPKKSKKESKSNESPQTFASASTSFSSLIDFDSMRQNYPDVVAWIKSENLNYPIVQGTDNNYYLSRLPNGKHHVLGSIFLDERNLDDFSEDSIILYGHDSRKGDMFGSLKYYASQEYYAQNSNVLIFTPKCDYNLMLIAGYIIDSAFEVPPMSFTDLADFECYITDIKNRSIFKSDIEVNYDEQLVSLVTCTPSSSINERLIIVGKFDTK